MSLGKGRKERLVPFNNSTAQAVRQYLADRAALAPAESKRAESEERRG